MNKLKKLNRIDMDSRDKAIVYINGKLYEGLTHAECINDYLRDKTEYELNETQIRPLYLDRIPSEDLEDIEDNLSNKRKEDNKIVENNINSIAFAHKNDDLNAIFIEIDTLQNVDLNTVTKAIKEKYPTFDIYEDFTCNDMYYGKEDFEEEFKNPINQKKLARLKKISIDSEIYKQTFDYTKPYNKLIKKDISEEELEQGFTKIDCTDCDGTGKFELPDGEEIPCNNCKGSGKVWVNVI